MDKVKIGTIVKAVGLKGQVKVFSYAGSKERYRQLEKVYAADTLHTVESVRFLKENIVLKLSGIDDRDAAEEAKGKDIFIEASELPELPEGEYYIRDVIGFSVFLEQGRLLGRLTDVIKGYAQDLYEVETADEKKALIPAVEEFVLDFNVAEKKIVVKLIEGLI